MPKRSGSGATTVRPSILADMPFVQAIYAAHVAQGTGSFEESAPSTQEMIARRELSVAQYLPHLVSEVDGQIAGFAYAAPYRARAAYRYTVEDSIYVAPDLVGRGIGAQLLQSLIIACQAASARQMIAVIGDSRNLASIALHRRFGFRHVGTLDAVGYKFAQWLDVVLMQRAL